MKKGECGGEAKAEKTEEIWEGSSAMPEMRFLWASYPGAWVEPLQAMFPGGRR